EKQGQPLTVAQRHHARSPQTRALLDLVDFFLDTIQERWPATLAHQLQDLDRGVVVVQHFALGRLPDQLVEGRRQLGRDRLHAVPLRRGRQRNLQIPLQALQAIERYPAAVFQEGDHAAGRGRVLALARLGRRRRREHLAAEVATQLL